MSEQVEAVTSLINMLIAENKRTATTDKSKKDQSKDIDIIFKEALDSVKVDSKKSKSKA